MTDVDPAKIRVLSDASAVAKAAAEQIAEAAQRAIKSRMRFRLGLSGGTTPGPLYQYLTSEAMRGRIDWSKVEALFADERAVPPNDPDSNFGMVNRFLLDPVGVPIGSRLRMRGEARDLDRAAREYESYLAAPIDLLVLGVGEDGHTASLFPGSAALEERMRSVLAVTGPKPPVQRLTITPPTIALAREVVVLATGKAKAHAVARALEGYADELPASLLRGRDWYLDREAASERKRGAATS